MVRSGLHRALRAGTSRDHQQVDSAFSRYDLADRGRYRDFLRAQSAAVLPLERALDDAAVTAMLPDWPARRRSHALQADLLVLGTRPAPPFAVGVPDRGGQIGILYVLEGSRLGARHLLRVLPPDLATVAASFLGHGGSGQPWPVFMQQLDDLAARHGADHDAILANARLAFGIFARAAEGVPA